MKALGALAVVFACGARPRGPGVPAERIDDFMCAATGAPVALPRDPPDPRPGRIRTITFERPATAADVHVWPTDDDASGRVQVVWSLRSGDSVTRAHSRVTTLAIASASDDAQHPAGTPWGIDGIWSQGVLLHREADEQLCQLWWAPIDGDIRPLLSPGRDDLCGYGTATRATLVADRIVIARATRDDAQADREPAPIAICPHAIPATYGNDGTLVLGLGRDRGHPCVGTVTSDTVELAAARGVLVGFALRSAQRMPVRCEWATTPEPPPAGD